MLDGKRILLGVTGGIAAYKTVYLLRTLQKAGAEVRVTMTPSATRFVGSETFASLSGSEVAVDIFPDATSPADSWVKHVHWGEWADLFVIAPCTANTLGKLVHGLADNMLTATALAARSPLLICPTMDGEMYDAPAMQRNLALANEYGYHILEPESGYLASGLEGKGRLPETDVIVDKISELLENENNTHSFLKGKQVVVTAGPTREYIDAVRFISNPSSGKMGFAMAEAAQQAGAEVTLIHGPVQIKTPDGVNTTEITSAKDLFEAIKEVQDADIFIMAAAVSDFAPVHTAKSKIKKDEAKKSLELRQTPDILSWLGQHKKKGQVLIGFAMETEELLKNAESKLQKKNADWIIANSLTEPGAGFNVDTNKVILLGGNEPTHFEGVKKTLAKEILAYIFDKTTSA